MSDGQSKRKRKKKVEVIEEITTAATATDGNFSSIQRDIVESGLDVFPCCTRQLQTQSTVSADIDIDPEDEESDHCDQLCEDQLLKTLNNDLSVHYMPAVSTEANVESEIENVYKINRDKRRMRRTRRANGYLNIWNEYEKFFKTK